MDVIIGMIIMAVVGMISVGIMFKTISQRYPPVKIAVYDRGLKQLITFRLWGFTIVKNNLFRLLLNEPEMCGDIRELEYDIEAGLTGKKRIYRAYRRHDYLFALKHIKEVVVQVPVKKLVAVTRPVMVQKKVPVSKKYPEGIKEVEELQEFQEEQTVMEEQIEYQQMSLPLDKNPPVIEGLLTPDGKRINATLSKDGLLFPYKMLMANEGLQEEEVSKGKGICIRFIDSQKSTKAYLQASNPLMTVIYTTLPVLLIVIALGVTLYLVMQGTLDSMVQITAQQAHIVAQLAEILNK